MKKLIYEAKFPVRWGDMDAFGHVNNSRYFTYFEQARTLWWESVGMVVSSEKEGPIIARAECSFVRPIKNPANLIVKLYVSSSGESSFTFYYRIYVEGKDNRIFAKGSTRVVWFDYQKNCSASLPERVLKYLK